jgi:hypothetical protein
MSAASSPESAAWMPDSLGPDTGTSSSASPSRTVEPCSPPAGPESPSTTMFMPYRTLMPDGTVDEFFVEKEQTDALQGPSGNKTPLLVSISSVEASPAKTSASQATESDSPERAPASSSSSPASSTLFDLDEFSSRTYPDSSPRTAVGTSESCLERWPTSGTAWRGGFSTHVSSECRSAGGACSSSEPSLTEILEPPQNVPARYSLSARAAQGILRRAEKRGRTIPDHLWRALSAVAEVHRRRHRQGGIRR